MRSTAPARLTALLTLCAALPACHARITDDPGALRAAAAAGRTASALEALAVAASLLAEIPRNVTPDEAVAAANTTFEAAFLGCAEVRVMTGETTGLWLTFPGDGCSIPLTGVDLAGSFSFETTSIDETSTWTVSFDGLQILDVSIDGAVTVVIEDNRRVLYDVEDLNVAYGDAMVYLDGRGAVITDPLLSDVVFDGDGTIVYDGDTFAFDVENLSRKLAGDCYPERGTVSVNVRTSQGLVARATVEFHDRGLDSDDSGLVTVMLQGEEHVAPLPERACAR